MSASTAAAAPNVRYIDAALSNRSGTGLPRAVVTYARNPWGSSATTLPFGDVHPGNKPSALSNSKAKGQNLSPNKKMDSVPLSLLNLAVISDFNPLSTGVMSPVDTLAAAAARLPQKMSECGM